MTGVRWCSGCNLPAFEINCPLCNRPTRRAYSDLRPFFRKEKKIIEKFFEISLPDHRYLFRRFNRIVLGGRTLVAFRPRCDPSKEDENRWYLIPDRPIHQVEQTAGEALDEIKSYYQSPIRYRKAILETTEDHIQSISEEAKKFIQSTSKKYKQRTSFISFSGGKDSIVTAILVSEALDNIPPLFFADTTLEHPQTYIFINRFAKKYNFKLIDYKKYRSPNDFFSLCRELGPPSIFYRWCCTVFKSYPVNKYYNEHSGQYLTFDGIRRAESSSRKKYEKVTRIKKIPKQIAAYPLIDWNEFEVWLYILSGALVL